jgi:hypothetical protein
MVQTETMRAACPSCGQTYRVPASAEGKSATCKGCGNTFHLARAAPAAASPRPRTAATPRATDDASALAEALAMEQPASGARPIPDPGAGPARVCPGCRQPVKAQAAICVRCGTDLRTGRAIKTQTESAPPGAPPASGARSWQNGPAGVPGRAAAPADASITLGRILAAPFSTTLLVHATVIVAGTIGWYLLMLAAGVAVGVLGRLAGLAAPVVGLVAIILGFLLGVLAVGWIARKLFEVADAYANERLVLALERGLVFCWLQALVINVLAAGPAGVAVVLAVAMRHSAPLLLLLVAVPWLLLYQPMGYAMAGARNTLNPVRVVGMIVREFPRYLLVLLVGMLFLGAAVGVTFLILMLAGGSVMMLAQSGGRGGDVTFMAVVIVILAVLAGWVIMVYGFIALQAMLGMLLRRQPNR